MEDELRKNVESAETVAHSKYLNMFLSLIGELDPDSFNFRKFLAIRQGNRSMQIYSQVYQDGAAELSDDVGLSNCIKCFLFLEHMNKSCAESLPSTLRRWSLGRIAQTCFNLHVILAQPCAVSSEHLLISLASQVRRVLMSVRMFQYQLLRKVLSRLLQLQIGVLQSSVILELRVYAFIV